MTRHTTHRSPLKKGSVPFDQQKARIRKEIKELEDPSLEEEIRTESPDGRPAHPSWRAKAMLTLIAGSLLAVLAISAVTYALWGRDEAMVVLVLGAVFAIAGNPVVWAMFFRGKEREVINEVNKEAPSNQEQNKTTS
tara:strand:- start:66614 stop:67024 length:411 start_codon:yes stop_codon:yes gene_type:complete